MQPNVIIITTDQQRPDSLSCYGSDFTSTPNFDRLAAEGTRFNRAYCSNPVCTPSRASIFSGLQVSRHGAWNVGTNLAQDIPLLSHRLAAAGYATHYVGKAHFQAFSAPGNSLEALDDWPQTYGDWHGPYYGFESVELSLGHTTFGLAGHYGAWLREQAGEAAAQAWTKAERLSAMHFGGAAYDWDLPTRLHSSVWTADRTIAWLRAHDQRRPFCLAVGFQDPHHPHCLPRDCELRVDPGAVPLPSWQDGELDDKPAFFNLARTGQLEGSYVRGEFPIAGQGAGFDYRQISEADTRHGRAYYYGMVRLIDRELGRILDSLDREGLADNTIVVCTSDHGELLGDHGLWSKGPFHYEQMIRVPLLIRDPARRRAGQVSESLASLVDLVPTVLEATGTTAEALDGVSLLPVLDDAGATVRQQVLVECVDDPHKLRLKSLVTADRKLTWYCDQDEGELYDLAADPDERQNHWTDERMAGDRAKLLGRLLSQLECLERRGKRYCYA